MKVRVGSALAAAALVSLTGCGSTGSDTSPAANPPTVSAPSASVTGQAWTRGTDATFTNDSGSAVKIGAGGYGNTAPDIDQSTLADGASMSASDPSGYGKSSVFARITYPDDKVVEMRVSNPVVGTPNAEWREGKMTTSWSSFPGKEETLDENESYTAKVAGHKVTFQRLADDDENKNWTVTLDD